MNSKSSAKPLRVVVIGGGSGGHITPVLSVAHELKQLQPDCQIYYVGQTGDALGDIPAQHPAINQVHTVRAGKFRRYHGEGLRQLLDLPTTAKNIRDIAYVATGFAQSYRLLRRIRPDVIFTRGSFVSVPVALAGRALGIPYITHDSDAIPSLANRLMASGAALHAVALPKELYPYPSDKTITTGIPISHEFRPRTQKEINIVKERLGFSVNQRVVVVTGGGLGAVRLNNAVEAIVADLLAANPDVVVAHLTGRNNEQKVSKYYDTQLADTARGRVIVVGYTTKLFEYSAVAEVVISRAGGTAMAEFAAQGKACIIVPNPQLTGGHQSKNAQALADRQAIRVVEEDELKRNPSALLAPLQALLDDPAAVRQLSETLHAMARPDAAKQLAMVLLEQANKHKQPPKETSPNETVQAS
jgi:UDP-N-acetylglucosamine--N-acetylmuramyl-(pentapeptide) pyrophosphoryl-undecaprenol N-acetylglucosamine transferase